MTAIDPYEAPDNVDPEVAAVVEEASTEYTDLNLQRRFRTMFALGAALLALMVWMVVQASIGDEKDSLRRRNETLTNTIESQQLLIDKLATQLDEALAQGAAVDTPEVVAAETPGADVSPAIGPAGERGEAGPAGVGEPGAVGAQGDVGATGSVGEQGSTGPRGLPGVAGADGAPGAAGADGNSIQGPAGPAGADGANGAPGADGADGAPGATGPQGPQGPPPSTFTCTPTNPLDLGEPWTCTTTS